MVASAASPVRGPVLGPGSAGAPGDESLPRGQHQGWPELREDGAAVRTNGAIYLARRRPCLCQPAIRRRAPAATCTTMIGAAVRIGANATSGALRRDRQRTPTGGAAADGASPTTERSNSPGPNEARPPYHHSVTRRPRIQTQPIRLACGGDWRMRPQGPAAPGRRGPCCHHHRRHRHCSAGAGAAPPDRSRRPARPPNRPPRSCPPPGSG